MGMKVGIAGFAGSGKSTVFEWLTSVKPDPAKVQSGQIGHAEIPDERLDWLWQHFKPKKAAIYAAIDFLDTPGLIPEERRDNPRRLAIMREAGGLLVILNGFGANPLAEQLRQFRDELLYADLEIVSKRIDKLKEQLKKPRPGKQRESDEHELALLERIVAGFEQGKTPAALGLREEEEKAIRNFQLLTLKPEMVLVNCGDEQLRQPLPADLLQLTSTAILAPAKLELELRELPEGDRQVFMEELGLSSFSRGGILRKIFYGMGQIAFFTVGEDECRAWVLPGGADAVEAAAQVHTHLARNINRARVTSYEDFKRVGSEKEAKAQGVQRLEGKTYVVQDGDIIEIL
jgi:ribosome-binding ATPase YchF (GTP1/OBG family)